MLQHTLRRNIPLEHWVLPMAIAAAGVVVGITAGKGTWLFLGALALLPLLFYWPVELGIGAIAMLLPFENLTRIGDERGFMSIAFVLGLFLLLAVGVMRNRMQWPSPPVLWWGIFLVWSATSILWAVDPNVSLEHLPTAVAMFLFYFAASAYRISEKEFKVIVFLTVLGGVAAGLVSVQQFMTGGGATFSAHEVRATITAGAAEMNPNRFGVRLLIPLTFAIGLWLSTKSKLAKLGALAAVGITAAALIMTMSRGSIVAATIMIGVFLYRLRALKIESVKPMVRRLATLVTVLVVIVGLAAPAALLMRFQNSTQDRGAGRFDIWSVGWVMVQHYPIAGAGFSNFPVVYNMFAGSGTHLYFKKDNNDAHNIYLAITVEEGFLGLLLFFLALRKVFEISSKCRKDVLKTPEWLVASEAAFGSILVASFFGNLMWDKTFWLASAYLAFAVTLQKKQAGMIAHPRTPTAEAI